MILYLKKWLNLCQLAGSDCMTTFAISWCVIFYLQVKGVLPSVYDLIKRNNESEIVDGNLIEIYIEIKLILII